MEPIAHSKHIFASYHRVENVKSKDLSPGELKRLSIAEEIVHGPMLLLVDEPVTGLAPKDAAMVMNVFREMVNQDRTVIVTLHQVHQRVSLLQSLHLD
jgi:ABC-type multidrug transport system ATPase subunit